MRQKENLQNPWAGLSSYEDPARSSQKLKFCGRESDTFDVTRLIDDNFVVTLYGKSGIGKTSLLNAGVFPALRREQYTPLTIRLGMTEMTQSFQDVITAAVEHAVVDAGGSVHIVHVVDEQTDITAIDYLWNWYARRQFMTADGQTTFPVVVFDQFEEVFRQPDTRAKAEVLLTQLHYLTDESHAIGDCIVDGEDYTYDFNFRFVLSIREDDLYRLEDSIDNCALTTLKRCRYRLRSLSEEGARSAILIPGEGLFRSEEQDQIVRTIIDIAHNNEDQSISTNLLSLVCNRIFVDFQKKEDADYISQSLVETFVKGNPFERFYEEATKGFSNKEKGYIEDHLVDSTGRRNSLPESDFLLHVPNGSKLLEGNTRILQRASVSTDGGNYRIELIHDSFCEPLSCQREKREKRRRRRLLLAAVGAVLFFAGITLFILYQMKKADQAMWSMMENKARFIAEKGENLIDGHDSYMARLLALEILPESLDKPDKPFLLEAEALLRDAMRYDDAVLRGHTEGVNSVAFSPDGKHIVSGSKDGTIRIWDVSTGRQVGEPLVGYDDEWGERRDPVYSVFFSPDGKRILSVLNSALFIWDAATGKQIKEVLLEGCYFNGLGRIGYDGRLYIEPGMNHVAFSPDGKRIIIPSEDDDIDGTIMRIMDVTTGRQIGEPLRHTNIGSTVAFSPDGRCVVVSSDDFTLCIFDAATGKKIGKPLVEDYFFDSPIAFSPDGKRIASVLPDDNVLCIFDAATGKQISEPIEGYEGAILSIAFSPDGKRVVSASEDKLICIWDVTTCKQIGEPLKGHTDLVWSVAFSPDGKRIVSASEDNTVRIWNVDNDKQNGKMLEGYCDSVVFAVAFSPDGKHIVSASRDNIVRIWDAITGRLIKKEPLKERPNWGKDPIAFSSDRTHVVSGASDGSVRIWDAATGWQIIELQQKGDTLFHIDTVCRADRKTGELFYAIDTVNNINLVSFSPDGKRIVSVSRLKNSTICIWDVATGEQIGEQLVEHNNWFSSVTFSPDGKYIVSGLWDRTIRIWDVATCKQIGEPLAGHADHVTSLTFSPDGKRLVSASRDKTIRIWDVATGEQIGEPLVGHTDWVSSVTFSPDGKYIVSGSGDKTIRFWDAATGKQIGRPLKGHTDWVSSVTFSPDGKRILSKSNDGTVRIWDFPSLQDLIDQTRQRFKDRQLTPEERKRYYLE